MRHWRTLGAMGWVVAMGAPLGCSTSGDSGSAGGGGGSGAAGAGSGAGGGSAAAPLGGSGGTGGAAGAPLGGSGGTTSGGSGGTAVGGAAGSVSGGTGGDAGSATGGTPPGLSLVQQDGAAWVDESGAPVRLRGLNLGNWFQLEFWMMGSSMTYSGGGIGDQCTLEGILTTRFGYAEKERLMGIYRDSWMTARDWDNLAALGINVVRVPFMYNLVEDETNPFNLRPDAFVYLDRAVDEAEQRGLYTVLDLHGAVGSQGWEHHSGCANRNELWGSTEYRDRTRWLWEQLAEHYRGRSAIAAYGLLNEPWGTTPEDLAAFSWELFDAVRAVDEAHVIVLPGHSQGVWAYGDPSTRPNTDNVALEMHFYPGFFTWRENDPVRDVHNQWLQCNVPASVTDWTAQDVCEWDERMRGINTAFLIGELQPWAGTGSAGGVMTRRHFDVYNMYGWAATAWAYKTVSRWGHDGSVASWPWGVVTNSSDGGTYSDINIETASIQDIETYFSGFAELGLITHPDVLQTMNSEPAVGTRAEAEIFHAHQGVTVADNTDGGGGFHVASLDAGDSLTYVFEIPAAGSYTLSLRVAAPATGGALRVLAAPAGSADPGTEVGSIDVPSTGDWQTYQSIETQVALPAGSQQLTLEVTAPGFDLDWLALDPAT
jgi:endoglucanase